MSVSHSPVQPALLVILSFTGFMTADARGAFLSSSARMQASSCSGRHSLSAFATPASATNLSIAEGV